MEAGHGTWAVESGNYRIFEEFAKRSGANIMLETTVTSVTNITEIDVDGNDITRFIVETSNGDAQIFDDVVVAAPLHKTNIQFPFKTQQHHRDYHTVHVTLVAGHSNPEFFGRTLENLPTFIVSTGEPLGKVSLFS
jgi:prenylcysteine oxidase/farnesylcysteine lyase